MTIVGVITMVRTIPRAWLAFVDGPFFCRSSSQLLTSLSTSSAAAAVARAEPQGVQVEAEWVEGIRSYPRTPSLTQKGRDERHVLYTLL